MGTKKNSDPQKFCTCQVVTSSLRWKLQGFDCSLECSTTPLTRKLLIYRNWKSLWAVTCAGLKEIEMIDISQSVDTFFRRSQCRWYRVLGIGIGPPLAITSRINILNLFYFPVFIEEDVLQWLPLQCFLCHICHDFPSLGITSTAYVVGWVGRVQNKWSAAGWKKTRHQWVQYQAASDTDIIHVTKIISDYQDRVS